MSGNEINWEDFNDALASLKRFADANELIGPDPEKPKGVFVKAGDLVTRCDNGADRIVRNKHEGETIAGHNLLYVWAHTTGTSIKMEATHGNLNSYMHKGKKVLGYEPDKSTNI